MKKLLVHKLPVLVVAVGVLVLLLKGNASAEGAENLTADILKIGMPYEEVKAIIANHPLERGAAAPGREPMAGWTSALDEAVPISSNYSVATLTHLAEWDDKDSPFLRTGQTLLIFRDGILISKTMTAFRWETAKPLDLDGAPGFVTSEYSGGAHCCYTYHVVALSPEPKTVQVIELDDSPGEIESCGERTCLNLVDDTFAEWRGPFATSIHAPVHLSLENGGFRFDQSLMRKTQATVSAASLNTIRHAFEIARKPDETDAAYRMLGQALLEFIYTGQAIQCEAVLQEVWPTDVSAKHAFSREFLETLRKSPYWNDLLAMNGGTIMGVRN
ncbi:MAG: hypothetical protein HQL36_06685 [Alphaproteobacteria bacterium]|nr:hypothetical protein [Alphaproteobacteria bacterium]